jgi:RNA polymerase sigma factor (sigma-70 family)
MLPGPDRVARALKRAGSVKAAARELGVARKTLARFVAKHGLVNPYTKSAPRPRGATRPRTEPAPYISAAARRADAERDALDTLVRSKVEAVVGRITERLVAELRGRLDGVLDDALASLVSRVDGAPAPALPAPPMAVQAPQPRPPGPNGVTTCSRCGFVGGNARGCGKPTGHATQGAQASPRSPASPAAAATPDGDDDEDPLPTRAVLDGKGRMSRADTVALVRAARSTNPRRAAYALDILVRRNIGLVHAFARKIKWAPVPYEDLVQEGTIGLIRGLREFDVGRDTALSTYVVWWIRHHICRCIENTGEAIRLPARYGHIRSRLYRAQQALGAGASPEDLAAYAKVGVNDVRRLLARGRVDVSLDAPRSGPDGELASLHETIPAEDPDAEDRADTEDRRAQIEAALAKLPKRERDVIRLRYLGEDGLTLKQVGQRLGRFRWGGEMRAGLSRERIRQIERDALDHLRAAMLGN